MPVSKLTFVTNPVKATRVDFVVVIPKLTQDTVASTALNSVVRDFGIFPEISVVRNAKNSMTDDNISEIFGETTCF